MSDSMAAGRLEEFLAQNTMETRTQDIRPHVFFPSDEMFDVYLSTLCERPEKEVLDLLWKMLSATTAQIDMDELPLVIEAIKNAPSSVGVVAEDVLNGGSIRRRLWRAKTGIGDAWEGMTWALEALPFRPGLATEALELYLQAQHGLPDDRIHAISDAIDIIRARWIGTPATVGERIAMLDAISPRAFEALIAALWDEMGFVVTLTPQSADGGYDVRAIRDVPGRRQNTIIECKRYAKPVGVDIVRKLVGALADAKTATTCVIVTNSRYTRGAIRYAAGVPTVELIPGDRLITMLNEYLGWDWPIRLGRITRSFMAPSS
jgi:restriction system protein